MYVGMARSTFGLGFAVALCLVARYCVLCETEITKVLFANYDKSQRPHTKGPPVVVEASLYVSSFGNIEEASMEYKVFGYFRQYWRDERLAGRHNTSVVLKGVEIDQMWKPDPFCYNARESSLTAADADINSMITIQPSGDIIYSRLTIIVAECDMNLRDFPMDEQECHLKFGSYSYSTVNIKYVWKKPHTSSVTIRNKNLAQFLFKSLHTKTYEEVYTLGNFSIMEVEFFFKRRLGYFLIQIYAPCIFVVMLSWIVFWMDRDDMGNRMALGITTILTIMFLLGSINAAMPRVSYPKALDWYLMVSFTLVFLVLIECMAVFVVAGYGKAKQTKKQVSDENGETKRVPWVSNLRKRNNNGTDPQQQQQPEKTDLLEMGVRCEDAGRTPPKPHLSLDEVMTRDTASAQSEDSRVDKVARVVFPLAFVCYNIAYWATYL